MPPLRCTTPAFRLGGTLCLLLPLFAALGTQAGAQAPSAPAKVPAPADPPPPALINPDRPGIADGSTVIGPRRFQIEAGYQNEFRKDMGSTERRIFVPTLVRFGIDTRWEARVEGNGYTFTRTTAPDTGVMNTDGLSPLSLGFKYHFQDQTAVGKHASLGTIFRLFPAMGSGSFKSNHPTGDLRLVADWDFTPNLSLNPNVGFAVYEDGQGNTFSTALLATTLNYFNRARTFNPFIDFGFQGPEERYGRSSLIVDAGVAYIVGRTVQIDLSVGTGVLGRTSPHPFISFGLSKMF